MESKQIEIPDKLYLANVGGYPAICLKKPTDEDFNGRHFDPIDDSIFPTLSNEDDYIEYRRVD